MIPASLLSLFAAFATGTQAVCSHNTHLWNERAEADATWGYAGLQGPLNWHSLNINNTKCAKSTQQTPINLNGAIKLESGAGYKINYPKVESAGFHNLGSTVEVDGDDIGGTLEFGGKKYNLAQFHFHTPSEHRIEEEFFPMEVHFVHVANDSAIAVVGFVIEIGSKNDALLGKILPSVTSIPNKGDDTELGPLSFTGLKDRLATNPVYRYRGSLTTPPCTDGLEWIVSKKPLIVDYATFNKAKKVLKFNARYTQNTPGQINLLQNSANNM